jgi:hypothetical protein
MKPPSFRLLRLLADAAMLRANAASWEMVAARVGRRPRTCKRWQDKYAIYWRPLYHAAQRYVLAQAFAEATAVLHDLRDNATDERLRRAAARALEGSR